MAREQGAVWVSRVRASCRSARHPLPHFRRASRMATRGGQRPPLPGCLERCDELGGPLHRYPLFRSGGTNVVSTPLDHKLDYWLPATGSWSVEDDELFEE